MSDQQNTVLAIVLSIVVIVAFEFLYFAPQREAMEAYVAQQEAAQTAAAIQAGDAPATPSAGDAPGLTGEAPSLLGGAVATVGTGACLLYTSPSPRDGLLTCLPAYACKKK